VTFELIKYQKGQFHGNFPNDSQFAFVEYKALGHGEPFR